MAEKEAFCLLLWRYQGGRVDDRNRKVIASGIGPSGSCDEPTDCYRCPLLQQEIALHPPGQTNWVCPACLTEISRKAKNLGKRIHMTGHYSEGQCQYVGCVRPSRLEFRDAGIETEDESTGWTAADLIERPRGYSRFLQLIIGDINT